MAKLVAILSLLLLASGCGRNPSEELARLSDEFIHTTLAFSPATATEAGFHADGKVNLDTLLDDMSPANLDKQRQFYQRFKDRLGELKVAKLTAEDIADLTLLRDRCDLAILDLSEVQSWQHDPTLYVEILGHGLNAPFTLEYAPRPDRIRHILARLQKAPLLLDQAMTNLTTAPAVWTQLATQENEGNIELVDKTMRASMPVELRDAFARAAQPALSSMRKFQDFLRDRLSARDADWRLGSDRYARKFRYAMNGAGEADNILAAASSEFTRQRARLLELALPIHRQFAPKHRDHDEISGELRETQVIGEVVAELAATHPKRDAYLDEARRDLEEARAFVQAKQLFPLPAHANLQLIPTPDFERGRHPAGGFAPAPAIEPALAAYFWVTPILPEWTAEQAESKLREYNSYRLRLLAIREAIPGLYLQSESAVQPEPRRRLRRLYGSDAYREAWAQAAEAAMLDAGYQNHSPELAFTLALERLEMFAAAILDIRLQMLNMTDQEALDLLEKQAFEQEREALDVLEVGKSTSAHLAAGYMGWSAWERVRGAYSGQATDFAARVLKEGAVPMTSLGDLLRPPRQP